VAQFQSPRFSGDAVLEDILNDPDTGTKKLGAGSPPDSVKKLQRALFDLGWTIRAGVTDSAGFSLTPANFVIGIYGPATTKTVLTFKTHYDIHFPPSAPTGLIDGFAGPRTLAKLDPQCVLLDEADEAIEAKADELRDDGHTVVLFTSTTSPTVHPIFGTLGASREAEDIDGSTGMLFYKRGLGAFEVHGPIFDTYFASGLATGSLGFPISDVQDDGPGFQRSDFENGSLRLDESTGTVDLVGSTPGVIASAGIF
jgi:hypothetical protein